MEPEDVSCLQCDCITINVASVISRQMANIECHPFLRINILKSKYCCAVIICLAYYGSNVPPENTTLMPNNASTQPLFCGES